MLLGEFFLSRHLGGGRAGRPFASWPRFCAAAGMRGRMVDNPVWKICERVAEVQALLDDHVVGGKHSAADELANASSTPLARRHFQRIGKPTRR